MVITARVTDTSAGAAVTSCTNERSTLITSIGSVRR